MALSPKRASFERSLLAGLLLLCPPFIAIACWRSGEPAVLGLWSGRLFALLCVYGLFLTVAAFFVFHPRAEPRKTRLLMLLMALRHQRIPNALAIAAPLVLFFAALAVIFAMGVVPTPIVVGCLLNAALLVVWAEIFLAISGRPDKERRKLALKFSAAGVATLVTVLLIELAAAIFGVGAYATWEMNPRDLDVRFQTDDFDTRVVTNRQGLREPVDIAPEHPGVYRVLVIGDSMTFGWGVEQAESYPKVAEKLLHEKYGHDNIEVINMGRPGAGPHEYLKYLRKYATRLNPDMIVIGFLIGNDAPVNAPAKMKSDEDVQAALRRYLNEANESAADQLLAKSFLIRLGYSILNRPTRPTSSSGVPGPIFSEPNPLGRESMLALAESLPDRDAARARYEHLLEEGWIEKGLRWQVNPWLMHAIVKNPGGAADSLAVRDETFEAMQLEWQLVTALLDEIQQTAVKQLQAKVVVLSIPNAHLVSQRWVDFLQERGCFVTETMTTKQVVNDWMKAWCEARKVSHIDPLDIFRTLDAEKGDLYLQTDDHMTPKGYQLLGEALALKIHELIDNETSE